LDADGQIAVPSVPKVHADFRNNLTPEEIELVRHGFWEVVNEDGGTGSVAQMKDVQVAGKTGTAQAMLNGKKDTVAWFCCFAPYDHPRYTIAVMVQGGEHGGSVAAPIATRILERTLAMDEGKFEPQLAWIAPARKPNPFAMIKAIKFNDALPGAGAGDEENASGSTAQVTESADMAKPGDAPDLEPEADARGRVQNAPRTGRVLRAQSVAPPTTQRPRNFFERIFGKRPQPAAPTPTPTRRARPAL
jgi:penicillin-binding protein 2